MLLRIRPKAATALAFCAFLVAASIGAGAVERWKELRFRGPESADRKIPHG